jgi:hypothetical protein
MDEAFMKQLDDLFDELQEFCTKTLAEVMVMRLQVNLIKESLKK